MTVETFHCLVIPHYDGSVVEAYKLFKGDSYRLQITKNGNLWSWKFGTERDYKSYLSHESALMACTGFLFRRTLQLSIVIEQAHRPHIIFPQEERLPPAPAPTPPRKFRTVDSIELGQTSLGFIDILESSGQFYAFYGDSTFSGAYRSKDECLKDIVVNIADRLNDFVTSIFRINTIINCLEL